MTCSLSNCDWLAGWMWTEVLHEVGSWITLNVKKKGKRGCLGIEHTPFISRMG